MVVSAAVVRPAKGKKFKKQELKGAIAGWGMKAKGVQVGQLLFQRPLSFGICSL
eukprot:SAG11_NODE_13140_length_668_cov_0.917399_1_plen_54_part_00